MLALSSCFSCAFLILPRCILVVSPCLSPYLFCDTWLVHLCRAFVLSSFSLLVHWPEMNMSTSHLGATVRHRRTIDLPLSFPSSSFGQTCPDTALAQVCCALCRVLLAHWPIIHKSNSATGNLCSGICCKCVLRNVHMFALPFIYLLPSVPCFENASVVSVSSLLPFCILFSSFQTVCTSFSDKQLFLSFHTIPLFVV